MAEEDRPQKKILSIAACHNKIKCILVNVQGPRGFKNRELGFRRLQFTQRHRRSKRAFLSSSSSQGAPSFHSKRHGYSDRRSLLQLPHRRNGVARSPFPHHVCLPSSYVAPRTKCHFCYCVSTFYWEAASRYHEASQNLP